MENMIVIPLNAYYTLILAALVLLLGAVLVKKIKILSTYNIPEPVAGGIVAAIIIYALKAFWGITFSFESSLQTAFMLIFFSSIGLSADFARLKSGGLPLVIFTVVVSVLIFIQNIVGVGLASVLVPDHDGKSQALIGVVVGSVTLTGGHGTAGAWGPVLENMGIYGATTLGMAAATFGLVSGGIIGGPVAKFLAKRIHRERVEHNPSDDVLQEDENVDAMFDKQNSKQLITVTSAIETLTLFAACLAISDLLTTWTHSKWFLDNVTWFPNIPTFVWALGTGVVIRNALTYFFNFEMFDRAIDVFGNVSLSLYLAMALLSLRLWELTDLAGPVLIILMVQVVVMILYAAFVTFKVMGSDYDAIVLAAGHCGFGLGATPTAVANMQSVTQHYGPSYKAFLIVPMVGAFFVDLINAAVLNGFINVFHP